MSECKAHRKIDIDFELIIERMVFDDEKWGGKETNIKLIKLSISSFAVDIELTVTDSRYSFVSRWHDRLLR